MLKFRTMRADAEAPSPARAGTRPRGAVQDPRRPADPCRPCAAPVLADDPQTRTCSAAMSLVGPCPPRCATTTARAVHRAPSRPPGMTGPGRSPAAEPRFDDLVRPTSITSSTGRSGRHLDPAQDGACRPRPPGAYSSVEGGRISPSSARGRTYEDRADRGRLRRRGDEFKHVPVHTDQHYDRELSEIFLETRRRRS
jgi:hypothetical protein